MLCEHPRTRPSGTSVQTNWVLCCPLTKSQLLLYVSMAIKVLVNLWGNTVWSKSTFFALAKNIICLGEGQPSKHTTSFGSHCDLMWRPNDVVCLLGMLISLYEFTSHLVDCAPFVFKEDNLWLPTEFLAHQVPSEKGITLKGNNLLPRGSRPNLKREAKTIPQNCLPWQCIYSSLLPRVSHYNFLSEL